MKEVFAYGGMILALALFSWMFVVHVKEQRRASAGLKWLGGKAVAVVAYRYDGRKTVAVSRLEDLFRIRLRRWVDDVELPILVASVRQSVLYGNWSAPELCGMVIVLVRVLGETERVDAKVVVRTDEVDWADLFISEHDQGLLVNRIIWLLVRPPEPKVSAPVVDLNIPMEGTEWR